MSLKDSLVVLEREGLKLKRVKYGHYVGANGEIFKQRLIDSPEGLFRFIEEVGGQDLIRKMVNSYASSFVVETKFH